MRSFRPISILKTIIKTGQHRYFKNLLVDIRELTKLPRISGLSSQGRGQNIFRGMNLEVFFPKGHLPLMKEATDNLRWCTFERLIWILGQNLETILAHAEGFGDPQLPEPLFFDPENASHTFSGT